MEFSWWKFGVAEFILVILPVWFIRMFHATLFQKFAMTLAGTFICWYAITYGGAKRGVFSKS